MRLVLGSFLVTLIASAASAQVIYLPVQYQYGDDQRYYYGGSDPDVFASAERTSALLRFLRVTPRQPRVYSDLFPYADAAYFGFTPNDARNEAYDNQPQYFRKADLFDHAIEVNGAYYVPPAPPARYLAPRPADRLVNPAQPARKPGAIIIIPKKNLEPADPARPVMFVTAS